MKIAVLASRYPFPLEKGDKLRLYHQIQGLSQAGHEVALFALHERTVAQGDLEVLRRWCRGGITIYPQSSARIIGNLLRGWMKGLPLQVAYFYQPALEVRIQRDIQAFGPELLYCQLIRMAPYSVAGPIPHRVLDYMDAFSGIIRRRAEDASLLLRPFWSAEARRLKRYEREVFDAFDRHTIISRRDQMEIDHPSSSRIAIVPNGVNTSFFRPSPAATPAYDIAFIGNMGYHPNVVAGRWLADRLMPRLQARHPELRLLLAGARPARAIQVLASERITVSGWVPDIREAYQSGRIFVAPLFHGGGQQNKILEAMAMGLPCITTSHVNEAIGGRHRKELLIADHEEAFSHQVSFLLDNPQIAAEIGQRARQFVQDHFSWPASNRHLLDVLEALASPSNPPAQATKE